MPEWIQNLTLGELTSAAIALVAISVEISPIKINPLSALFKWLGKQINGSLVEKIEAQEKKLDDLQDTMNELRDTTDDNEIDRIRWEIISFSNSCRNGKHHTLKEFNHIIDLNGKYHKILDRRNLKNGKIDLEYEYIIHVYKECQLKNSFL